MNTKLLSISLALVTSVLVACGGGGDARSPDRPSPKLDPQTLRIEFPLGNKLAGLGTNKADDGIPARMLGLQTDGVETNLGPELNVTEGTTWTISGPIGDPAIAGLAPAVRSVNGLGNVKDILSTDFLAEPSGNITLKLTGTYRFNGVTHSRTADFIVVPPKRVDSPFIGGPEIIAIDPLDASATATANYQLLQALQGLTMQENRTGEAKFCTNQDFFTFGAFIEGQSSATATITNPFNSTNNQEGISVIISTIPSSANCDALYDGDPDNNPPLFAVKTVKVQPASVKSVDVCVITNPATLTCKNNGDLDQSVTPLASCQGIDTPTSVISSATVPAAASLQLVAKLHYENPANVNQSFNRYQCSAPNLLNWTSTPNTIYSTALSATGGTATLIGQLAYDAIRNDNTQNNSTVTAKYNNSSTQTVEGKLKLNLTDETVTKITITPKDDPVADDKKYEINLSVLETEKVFKATCTYPSGDAPCGSGTVNWSVGKADTLKVNPLIGSETTASPTTPATPVFGTSSLIATYKNSTISDTVSVEIVDDEIEDLLLMQQDDETGDAVEDEFSCLGSGNVSLNASQENGLEVGIAKGSRQFFAHAKFKSKANYVDITNNENIVFTADVGYYNGTDNTCVTQPQSADIPIPVNEISASKPAAFSSDPSKKGVLEAQGEARFSTMCVRVFIDRNNDKKYDPPGASTPAIDSEMLSSNGATTLVQPAGTIALADQAGSACAIFEPLLSGDNPLAEPVLLPALFELGYYADPVLSNIPVDQITGQLPIEEINEALMSGDLSAITDLLGGDGGGLPPPPEGLPGAEQIAELAEALNPDTLAAIADACLVTQEDVTGFFGTLTGGDPQAALTNLLDGSITSEDCAAAFPIPAP